MRAREREREMPLMTTDPRKCTRLVYDYITYIHAITTNGANHRFIWMSITRDVPTMINTTLWQILYFGFLSFSMSKNNSFDRSYRNLILLYPCNDCASNFIRNSNSSQLIKVDLNPHTHTHKNDSQNRKNR